MRLDPEDDDDRDDRSNWYEPPRPEDRRETPREAGRSAVKALLEFLGPAPLQADAGGAYREHLLAPPMGPDGAPCACIACQRVAELAQSMSKEQAITRVLEGLRR